MKSRLAGWIFALALLPIPARGDDPSKFGAVVPIDDFEAEPKGWKFVGGEEFPGAKGSLALDKVRPGGGKGCYKLDADFRGGGAYVGTWKDLEGVPLPEVAAFRLKVRSSNVGSLGVRVVDASGQCHQSKVALPSGADGAWREVVLKLGDLVGGEHWGGLNDGAWHGPPKGLGINLGKDSVGDRPAGRATLWLDDLDALAVLGGRPTLRSCSISPGSARPGFGGRISYSWDAEPLGANCSVFVHFVDPGRGWSSRPTTTRRCRRAAGRAGSSIPARSACRSTPRRGGTTSSSACGTAGRPRKAGAASRSGSAKG